MKKTGDITEQYNQKFTFELTDMNDNTYLYDIYKNRHIEHEYLNLKISAIIDMKHILDNEKHVITRENILNLNTIKYAKFKTQGPKEDLVRFIFEYRKITRTKKFLWLTYDVTEIKRGWYEIEEDTQDV